MSTSVDHLKPPLNVFLSQSRTAKSKSVQPFAFYFPDFPETLLIFALCGRAEACGESGSVYFLLPRESLVLHVL